MRGNDLRVLKYEHVPLGIDYNWIFYFNDGSELRELDIITNDFRDGSLFYIVKIVDNAVYCLIIGEDSNVKLSPLNRWFVIDGKLREES